MTRRDVFEAATAEGIITAAQADRLRTFAVEYDEFPVSEMDPEAPRFIRGFHDILITIGIGLGLGGLAAVMGMILGSSYIAPSAVAAATWALSELLVRRLRLGLPAAALAVAFTISGGIIVSPFVVGPGTELIDDSWAFAAAFLSASIAAGFYFMRFRVPLSLALCVGAFAASIVAGFLAFSGVKSLGTEGAILVLMLALAIFALALAFDFSDPARRTRRSDYAFWLHLIAAPALIGSVMNFLVGYRSAFQLSASLQTKDAAIVIAVMLALSILAILIDRRAFLVAGLGYFGAAIFTFAEKITVQDGLTGAVTIMILGAVVLVLALGWQKVRHRLLAPLPGRWTHYLPPIRKNHPAAAPAGA